MYELILATLDVEPAYIASVTVAATSRQEAVSKAMSLDFSSLEWTDAAGNSVPWDDIDSDVVTVAE